MQKIFREGIQINIYPYKIFVLKTESSPAGRFKVLISVPKKQFKKAVDRNLLKRRIREAYRLNKHILGGDEPKPEIQIAIALIYSADEIHDYGLIHHKMIEALERIKHMIDNQMV